MKNRKLRILSALLALAMLLALVPTAAFAAGDSYTLIYSDNNDDTVTVIGYTGTINGALTIPATIAGKEVAEVGMQAFANCDTLKELTVAAKSINMHAFVGCKNLRTLTIKSDVTTIRDAAFFDCSSLETVTLENGVETIGQQAFNNCSKITSIKIPASVKTIGEAAFLYCSSLETVTLEEGIQTIGAQAFANCSKITNLVIPASVETIGQHAFAFDIALKTVYFTPISKLKTVGSVAFNGCDNLESIYYEGNNNVNWGSNPIKGSPWVVAFNTDGGSEVAEQFVKNNLCAEKPAEDPTKEGYLFAGWYADKDCTQPFDFENTDITGKTNVYAKWSLVWSPMEKARYKLTLADCTAEVDGKEVESGAYVQEGAAVEVTFKKDSDAGSNLVFDGWEIEGLENAEQYQDKESFAFTMPKNGVTIAARAKTVEEDSDWDAGTVVTTAVLGTGVAVLAYHIGTEVYAEQVLGAGVAVPRTRGDVALKAWELAGKPAVENAAVAPEEAAQAQQWVLESGLMENQKDGTFHPEKRMGKLKALRVLEKAQKMG